MPESATTINVSKDRDAAARSEKYLVEGSPAQSCAGDIVAGWTRGTGGIINVASLGGYVPGPYQAAYYASKSALLSASRAIAAEVRQRLRLTGGGKLAGGPTILTEYRLGTGIRSVPPRLSSTALPSGALGRRRCSIYHRITEAQREELRKFLRCRVRMCLMSRNRVGGTVSFDRGRRETGRMAGIQ